MITEPSPFPPEPPHTVQCNWLHSIAAPSTPYLSFSSTNDQDNKGWRFGPYRDRGLCKKDKLRPLAESHGSIETQCRKAHVCTDPWSNHSTNAGECSLKPGWINAERMRETYGRDHSVVVIHHAVQHGRSYRSSISYITHQTCTQLYLAL